MDELMTFFFAGVSLIFLIAHIIMLFNISNLKRSNNNILEVLKKAHGMHEEPVISGNDWPGKKELAEKS